ncbi:hypothetical protein BX616_010787 [Lobosporangium transversale]|uniref:Ubiquitin carboxyl-terminal hydrolase n=1 Tax=Lobosporangium transversale TaxID=64571 RepID=A0A1Y2GP20_9FUNG|nr:hypothetical protein BCR41DRAFT_386352 [Lobosporangium transversale]KAF9910751.1 hypothetical protein BX616_010787 [Lobosporangium transversale]ORZ16798.1 hypothetical protein BCR41DRAFT_386352 [Lobosporangium transversale]|eukprot:XP_021881733.1 hypothetical protein BCR41DRAFT_386352 [Lobosporangium transversale]
MTVQEMLQKLLHPPPLAVVVLIVSFIVLLPQKHKQWISKSMASILVFDLMMLMETLPIPIQTQEGFVFFKARILDPLTRILLGWESDDNDTRGQSVSGADRAFTSSSLLFPLLPEHFNATRSHSSDRSKITSRAQLQQLRQGNTNTSTQGLFAALEDTKISTTPSFPYVYGLVNTGNSCFLNSVLQALSALTILPQYLESILSRSDGLHLEDDEVQVTEALLDTVEALQKPLGSHQSFRPRAIVSALEESRAKDSKSSRYHIMNREQQDAQELFQIISSALSSEEMTIQRLQATRPLLNLDFLKKLIRLGRDQNEHQLRKQDSNPMIGMLASRLSCVQCGYTEAVRHFTFDNLSLSLPSSHSCSIEDCLRQYINLESLHDVICRKCSLLATLTRTINEIKRLDSQLPSPFKNVSRQLDRSSYTDISSEDDSNDLYSESDEGSIMDDSDDDIVMSKVTPRTFQSDKTMATTISKLKHQKTVLEDALKSDVERPLPDIKLLKVVSRHCTKQVMIAKPPPVLCLHFIRSQYSDYGTVSKNSCQVRFPEYLDISAFCTTGVLLTHPTLPLSISDQDLERMGYDWDRPVAKTKQQSKQTKQGHNHQQSQPQQQQSSHKHTRVIYKLQSIVVHYGGHSYGHFIAYRRKPENMLSKIGTVGLGLESMKASRAGSFHGGSGVEDWFRVSDEMVESVTLDHVLRSNPYMCLYERVELPEDRIEKVSGTVTSSLSLQAVELGLRKLLLRNLKSYEDGSRTAAKEMEESQQDLLGLLLDPNQVDLTTITEKKYASLFREQPKAISALSRMGRSGYDEDMSDMDSVQSYDEDRAWRSFVSSPNSTMPPSPNTGSSDSSAASSSFASPILKQRKNKNKKNKTSSSMSTSRTQSIVIPDLDLAFNVIEDSIPSPHSSLSTPINMPKSTSPAISFNTTTKSDLSLPSSSPRTHASSTAILHSHSSSKARTRRKN